MAQRPINPQPFQRYTDDDGSVYEWQGEQGFQMDGMTSSGPTGWVKLNYTTPRYTGNNSGGFVSDVQDIGKQYTDTVKGIGDTTKYFPVNPVDPVGIVSTGIINDLTGQTAEEKKKKQREADARDAERAKTREEMKKGLLSGAQKFKERLPEYIKEQGTLYGGRLRDETETAREEAKAQSLRSGGAAALMSGRQKQAQRKIAVTAAGKFAQGMSAIIGEAYDLADEMQASAVKAGIEMDAAAEGNVQNLYNLEAAEQEQRAKASKSLFQGIGGLGALYYANQNRAQPTNDWSNQSIGSYDYDPSLMEYYTAQNPSGNYEGYYG